MRRRRLLTAVRVGAALVAGSVLLGNAGPTSAQTPTPSLAGIQGRAAASGVRVVYGPQGLLPISPLVEIGAPDALATIASGPSTFARASVLDPGDIIANPGTVLGLLSPDLPAEAIPPYPFRVSVSSGIGPTTAESNPAPGLNAKVEVTPNGSQASASMPAALAPAIATFGTVRSEASTTTDGSTVTVTARTEITNVNLLGLLTVESIVSEAVATSDGGDTVLDGGTTIVGASVLGQPVTIDAAGVHTEPGPSGPGSSLFGRGGLLGPEGLLGGLLGGSDGLFGTLAALGIDVTVVGPTILDGRTSGQLTTGGLHIAIDISEQRLPILTDVFNSLPPLEAPIPGLPGPEDLIALARARHLGSIEFGRAHVSLAARPGAEPVVRPPAEAPTGPAPSPLAPSPGGSISTPVASPPVLPPAAVPPAGPAATVPVASEGPATSLAAGIGAFALVLALLAQPLAGRGLAALATGILGAADHCPREER